MDVYINIYGVIGNEVVRKVQCKNNKSSQGCEMGIELYNSELA